MKCISLWQPWASAIAVGAKTIETRSWETLYRGKLAIHAAKRCPVGEMIGVHCSWNWCAALAPMGVRMGQRERLRDLLPFGAVVAVCDLVDCRRTETFTVGELDIKRFEDPEKNDPVRYSCWTERWMGNYTPGRFGWVLKNIVRLPKPIPFTGRQGLFDIPDRLLEAA